MPRDGTIILPTNSPRVRVTEDTRAAYAEQVRGWRAEMDRLGYETVSARHAQRRPVTDGAPHPDAQTVEAWLREQAAATERLATGHFKTIQMWIITAAIAGVIAAIAMTTMDPISLIGPAVAIWLFLYFRHRWRKYQRHSRGHVAPENELECLEELAEEHRLGTHDYSNQIEQQIEIIENTHEPSSILNERLKSIRDALEEGNARRAG